MHGDPKFSKFFLYLNLFAFSMLLLVLGENLLVTFLGWEGVGTCSYLLISFWHTRASAATAGKKAFVTNRVGDFGLHAGDVPRLRGGRVVELRRRSTARPMQGSLARSTATAIAAMLFLGAVGKSAQLPLYLWLPDAMEGPTPVSALIHAATMVTAGVFLMVRMNPVLSVSRRLAADDDRLDRRDHGAVRRHDRRRPERHQEGPRLLDGEPARLHVPRRRVRARTSPRSST